MKGVGIGAGGVGKGMVEMREEVVVGCTGGGGEEGEEEGGEGEVGRAEVAQVEGQTTKTMKAT